MGIDAHPDGHTSRSKPPANLTVPLPGTAGAPPLTWLPGSSSSSSACVLRPYSRGWPQRLHDILVSAVDHRQRGINLGPGVHLRLAKRARLSEDIAKADGDDESHFGGGSGSGGGGMEEDEEEDDFDLDGDLEMEGGDDSEGDIEFEVERFAHAETRRRSVGRGSGERGVLADAFNRSVDTEPMSEGDSMHANTKRMAHALKENGFDEGESITYNRMAANCDRYDVAVGFWQLLALSTRGYVNLKQTTAFGDIEISKRDKFDSIEMK